MKAGNNHEATHRRIDQQTVHQARTAFSMKSFFPHFLLLATSQPHLSGGHWRFVLESLQNGERMDVRDFEPATSGERLELMAVLRGLEALDQPARVTLVTPSRYVVRGIRFGLEAWRQNGWHWESHGDMVPVKDHDLWKRLDQALGIHEVRMRHWTTDVIRCRRRRGAHPRSLAASASGVSPPRLLVESSAPRQSTVPTRLTVPTRSTARAAVGHREPGARLVTTVKTLLRRLRNAVDLAADRGTRTDYPARVA